MEWYEILIGVIVWIFALWLYGYMRENYSSRNYNDSWRDRKK